MNITYDEEKIKQIILDLSTVTGLSFAFVDNAEFPKTIYSVEKDEDEFCHRIQSTSIGKVKCKCSDMELIERSSVLGRTVSHICHAGVLDTAVPIKKDGITVGTIFIGRVRTDECTSDIINKLSWLKDDVCEIEKRYKKLSYYSIDKLESLTNLISNLIFEGAIHIDHKSIVGATAKYIEENLEKDLTVDIICKKLFVSKNKLYREFHSSMKCTVNEFITRKRMERARELLLYSTDTTKEIADKVGIPNYTYFSKLFKKNVGMSPAKYRKINR